MPVCWRTSDPAADLGGAPDVQAYFQQNGNQTFPFISSVTKDQLAGKFGPGGAFHQALPGNTPVFGLVNYMAPADAGGDAPRTPST